MNNYGRYIFDNTHLSIRVKQDLQLKIDHPIKHQNDSLHQLKRLQNN